jgi:hypothetical protein
MDLSTLDHEALRFLVAEDARRKASPEASAELRKEENLQLWSDFLHELNKDLESQFMERKADAQAFQNACFNAGPEGKREWFEYKAQYDQWRAGARRFQAGIQQRIKENRQMMRDLQRTDDRQLYRDMLDRVQTFLRTDAFITYRGVPERDRLVDDIQAALFSPRR